MRRHTISEATAQLPMDPGSANVARRFAADFFAAHAVDGLRAEDAILLVSEVVSNAIEHTPGSGPVRLDLRLDHDGGIHVAVSDDSDDLPKIRVRDGQAHRGRGLQLVEALATEWGVRTHPGGKTVWFAIAAI